MTAHVAVKGDIARVWLGEHTEEFESAHVSAFRHKLDCVVFRVQVPGGFGARDTRVLQRLKREVPGFGRMSELCDGLEVVVQA